MVAIKQNLPRLTDGNVDLAMWLNNCQALYHLKDMQLIQKSAELAFHSSKGLTTFYGLPCIEQGLMMAEILLELQLDQESITASIMISTLEHTKISDEVIAEKLNPNVLKLIHSVNQMSIINALHKNGNETQIDRLRKTILAMVSDIRVVLIKLAEKTCILRSIKNINPVERKRIAQEILDIYAPLANRLGIGQLKWELEDISFHYIDPEKYKAIASYLAEKRIDRQERIQKIIACIQQALSEANINASISGRAKHIYSIYLKMQKKHLDYKYIYDTSAVRILAPTIADCYNTLSIVHHIWEHIVEEFDDYIANPKPNGYRSIHTAVIGPDNKNLEIQIRTHDMHNEAEHGVAAHWLYKEDYIKKTGYEAKITFLRQLLSWQKDITGQNQQPEKAINEIFDDRVYIFTPSGDIIDLINGATPLDFAYHIHSDLGHRCRGAKINGHIVPLTHTLTTGDKVEIISVQNGAPSRDWLNKESGYLKTPRARAKVLQWFKQQDVTQYVESGKNILEREFARAGLQQIDMQKIASRFNFKNTESLYATLGHGSIRPAQIVQAALIDRNGTSNKSFVPTKITRTSPEKQSHFEVSGINDLLTRIAKCCKPIPGDSIIGYITQGRGVSIHRTDCHNITEITEDQNNRLIPVSWDNKQLSSFYVDIQIRADGQPQTLKEITTVMANAKINIITMNSNIYKHNTSLLITMTIEIKNKEQLNQIIIDIKKLPHINDAKRIHHQ